MNKISSRTFLVAVAFALSLGAQNQPSIQITSPANGSVVNPGQTLSVSVSSPSGTAFSSVFAIAEYPIGVSTDATSVPAQLSITIPSTIDCGVYILTANGTTSSGQTVSSSIKIDVERPDLPVKLTAPPSLTLESLGEQITEDLTATFSDNSVLPVTESTYITYNSSNPSVATIDSSGKITAVAPGNSWITYTYTVGGKSVTTILPVTVANPMVTVSPTSLTFGSQPVGTSSSAQMVTLTNAFTSNISIQRVSTNTPDYSESDNCIASSPLTPGNGCTVNVTFSPTAGGTRTGTLNIQNSANIIPISVYLSGTGTSTPDITGLSPTSGSVGTSVTITGVNFGATQGTSTVTFNGTTATPTSWSNTSIVVPVPTGATTGNVVVTVNGTASNGVRFTVNPLITHVQQAVSIAMTQTWRTSASVSFSSATKAGNTIIVSLTWGAQNTTITATDTEGNTYSRAVQTFDSRNPQLQGCAILYAANIKGGADTINLSFSPQVAWVTLAVHEFSGLSGALDVTAGSYGTGAAPSSGSATTTANGDLIFGTAEEDTNGKNDTYTAGSGFTLLENLGSTAGFADEDQVQSSAGPTAATWTLSPSGLSWVAVMAAFKSH